MEVKRNTLDLLLASQAMLPDDILVKLLQIDLSKRQTAITPLIGHFGVNFEGQGHVTYHRSEMGPVMILLSWPASPRRCLVDRRTHIDARIIHGAVSRQLPIQLCIITDEHIEPILRHISLGAMCCSL
jgi:hypothetical protein